MVSLKQLEQKNAEVDLAEQRALVSGGTQGIGAGIALRFALAGASVWIIGSNEARAKEVLAQLEKTSTEADRRAERNSTTQADGVASAKHKFFQADLSKPAEVVRVVQDISNQAGKGGIDYLIETQGGPPHGQIQVTEQGIESQFAVQVLSRFGLAKMLTDNGTIKRGILMVASPASGRRSALDLDDLDFVKRKQAGQWWGGLFGVLNKSFMHGSLLDSTCQTLAEKHPNLSITHAYPGAVMTNSLANQGHHWLLVTAAKWLGPLFATKAGPGGYAEVPFHVLAHPDGQRYLESGQANLIGPYLQKYSLSPNVTDKKIRDKIWDKLASYL